MTRFLTQDLPGTGGRIKQYAADFQVEELPAYPFRGSGEHAVLLVEKTGITTYEMITRLAQSLGVREKDCGFAGIKDARAVTRQWVSVPATTERRLEGLTLQGVEVLEVTRHPHKLRPGHLRGNRFRILLRDPVPDAAKRAERILAVLARRGVPNAFGMQRFGSKDDSDRIGRALLAFDFDDALHWFLGAPSDRERDARIREARAAFDAGRGAVEDYPPWMRNERKALGTYLRTGRAAKALATIPKNLRLLFLSAYQSRLFNRCLDRRLDEFDVLWDGDVAVAHPRGGAFLVEDAAAEAARAEAFAISPAGPLFGPGLILARGRAAALEDEVFREEGLDPLVEQTPYRDVHLKGERRAYRFPLRDVHQEPDRHGLWVGFALPRGCYATAVLHEVMKTDADADAETD